MATSRWMTTCRASGCVISFGSPNSLSTLALLLTVACATSGSPDRAAVLLSNAPPPEGRLCHAATNPATLPATGALVDSAGLIDSLRVGSGQRTGSALLSLRFDDRGHPVWVRVIESNLGSDEAPAVESLVTRMLRTQAPAPGWSVRLKVLTDTAPRLQVGRSELCPAVPSGTVEITTRQVVSGRSLGSLPVPTQHPRTPRFAILVDTIGRLLDSRLVESSGDDDVDRQVQAAFQNRQLRPTLLDGAPIVAWTEWPPPKQ